MAGPISRGDRRARGLVPGRPVAYRQERYQGEPAQVLPRPDGHQGSSDGGGSYLSHAREQEPSQDGGSCSRASPRRRPIRTFRLEASKPPASVRVVPCPPKHSVWRAIGRERTNHDNHPRVGKVRFGPFGRLAQRVPIASRRWPVASTGRGPRGPVLSRKGHSPRSGRKVNRRPGSVIPARLRTSLANGCETRVTPRRHSQKVTRPESIARTRERISARPHAWADDKRTDPTPRLYR